MTAGGKAMVVVAVLLLLGVVLVPLMLGARRANPDTITCYGTSGLHEEFQPGVSKTPSIYRRYWVHDDPECGGDR